MLEDKNDKQVGTITGGSLKNKDMLRYKKEKRLYTYAGVVSIGKLSNEREE